MRSRSSLRESSGVDLDTEDWPAKAPAPAALPGRLVWARTFATDSNDPRGISGPNKVLGGEGSGVCYGLTAMQPDSDYVTREYSREFRFGGAIYWSFPVIIHRLQSDPNCAPAKKEPSGDGDRDEERLLIRYRGEGHEIDQISASAVLDRAALVESTPGPPAVERLRTILSGRTVLLGGTYSAGRDRYPTPVGMLSGVEILAHAILTAHAGAISELSGRSLIPLDLGLGIGVVMLGPFYPRTALLLNVAILVLLIPLSALLFRSFALFVDTMPVQVSVLLHHLLNPIVESKLHKH